MVPSGGLFVPESVPHVPISNINGTDYRTTAKQILGTLLTDYSDDELQTCVEDAYNRESFDIDSIIALPQSGPNRWIMELWHGPTAAFKDMALQIMPHFLHLGKEKCGATTHTVILVATSGDTGKAALEGFKNCDGISIIVFYPFKGVSEIQELQMVTTDGNNTHVVAVRGNFDDCQTGVKQLFGNDSLKESLTRKCITFSSANSINWGRLAPQIVYYYQSYISLRTQGVLEDGDEVDFCVPTGNFGNILAGYYAKLMGLPIRKLICASNRNNILTDFFTRGTYDLNREFYQTISPAMDILISSNLERFLFEITGHDSERINEWYTSLTKNRQFSIDSETKAAIGNVIDAAWVDEEQVRRTINEEFKRSGYVMDTHTAVAFTACNEFGDERVPTIVVSTASPYKFGKDVLGSISDMKFIDEFASLKELSKLSATPIHPALRELRQKPIRHKKVIDIDAMENAVNEITTSIDTK